MGICGSNRFDLKNAESRLVICLTLAVFFTLISRLSCADSPTQVISQETRARISEVENYIKQKSFNGLSLLPSEARSVLGLVSGQWHPISFSTNDSNDDTGEASLVGSGEQETVSNANVNFGSNFHHKGFLPTHDALLMGLGIEENAFNKKLNFTLRPFYGQGWKSVQGYWGSEVAMTVARRPDGTPWGKISVAYIDGNEALTDHGRGIDLHSDIDLTHHFIFTSGVRQDDISGASNYTLIRWKFSFEGNSR